MSSTNRCRQFSLSDDLSGESNFGSMYQPGSGALHPRHGINSPDASKEASKERLSPPVLMEGIGPLETSSHQLGDAIGLLSRIRREQADRQSAALQVIVPPPPAFGKETREASKEKPSQLPPPQPVIGEASKEKPSQLPPPQPVHEVALSHPPKDKTDKRQSHRKRNRHSSWSEHLSSEVARLKLRNSQLEDLLEEAGVAQQTLEEQLAKAQQHQIELDMLAREGIAGGSVAFAIGENKELRKQLAAYAVEIDILRKEKQDFLQKLQQADKRILKLREEREEALSSKKDVSKALIEAGKTSQEQTSLAAGMSRRKDLKISELSDLVEDLNRVLAVLQDGYVAQTKEFQDFVVSVQEHHVESKASLEQAGTVLMTDHFHATSTVTKHMFDMNKARVDHMRRAEDAEQRLAVEIGGTGDPESEELKRRRYASPGFRDRERLAHGKLQRIREWREVLEELMKARDGIMIEKVSKRNGTRNVCRLVLDDQNMYLCWAQPEPVGPNDEPLPLLRRIWKRKGKAPQKRVLNRDTKLDLYNVTHIEYGSMSRACVVHKDVKPWHSISVYTDRRSYDFVCPDDDTTRCFVLVLSRLCNWATGVVRSRHAFECRKGWCKIHEHCFAGRQTLSRAFLHACSKATASERREHRPRQAEADANRRGHAIDRHKLIKGPGSDEDSDENVDELSQSLQP
jgi:hypothetical protein